MTAPIRKLAICGASARAAAFSAIRAGYEVVAADLFADADLARVAPVTQITGYPDALADWLAATECDAWMYTGALENYADLVDRMATIRPLLGNSGDVLRRVRTPMELQTALAAAGLLFPETRSSSSGTPHDGSWLCKTYAGASGSGVWRLDGEAAANRAERERAAIQRFVPGEPAAAIYIASAQGCRLVGVTRQWVGVCGGRPWQYVGSVGPRPCDEPVRRQLQRIGEMLATEFDLRGLIGVDVVLDGSRVWVIEVNPRYTASVEVLEQGVGQSSIAAHVAACAPQPDGEAPVLESTTARASGLIHGKAIVLAPRTAAILPSFFQWASAGAEPGSERAWLADIPRSGEVIPAGRPILTVFADGRTVEDCERRLTQRIAEVESQPFGFHGETL